LLEENKSFQFWFKYRS